MNRAITHLARRAVCLAPKQQVSQVARLSRQPIYLEYSHDYNCRVVRNMSRTMNIGRASLITMSTLDNMDGAQLAMDDQEEEEELSGEKDIPGT